MDKFQILGCMRGIDLAWQDIAPAALDKNWHRKPPHPVTAITGSSPSPFPSKGQRRRTETSDKTRDCGVQFNLPRCDVNCSSDIRACGVESKGTAERIPSMCEVKSGRRSPHGPENDKFCSQ